MGLADAMLQGWTIAKFLAARGKWCNLRHDRKSQRAEKGPIEAKKPTPQVIENWCPREDSNLHDLAITSS
jgi:hypothetical protein